MVHPHLKQSYNSGTEFAIGGKNIVDTKHDLKQICVLTGKY